MIAETIDVFHILIVAFLTPLFGFLFYLRRRGLERIDSLEKQVAILQQKLAVLEEAKGRNDEIKAEVEKVKELITALRLQLAALNRGDPE